MAQGHPIAAAIFVTLVVAGIAGGAQRAVQHQREQATKEATERAQRRKANIEAAVARGQAGDFEGAATLLTGVLRDDEDDLDAAYNLGIALSAMGRHDDAEKLFSAILKKVPEDYDAMAELGAVYDAKGDAARAIQLLERIPVGKADIQARLQDEGRWTALKAHANFAALCAKHGVTRTSTASEP